MGGGEIWNPRMQDMGGYLLRKHTLTAALFSATRNTFARVRPSPGISAVS
jgi:hypothetical protein